MKSFVLYLNLVVVFKNVLSDKVISKFVDVINSIETVDFENFLSSYSDFISTFYASESSLNLYSYLKKLIYTDENIISKSCLNINNQILDIAKYELTLFDRLLIGNFNDFITLAKDKFPESLDVISHLPVFNTDNKCNFDINDIIQSYKNNGYGYFANYNAFRLNENKEIVPVKYFEAMTFNQLKNYDYQKQVIKQNTKAFVEGKECNNILLYGDRGCGKSSTVKALVNEFNNYNLKIIQISKEELMYLPELYEKIRNLPLKFIIYADDISFEDNDKNFSLIKAALEGNLENRPKNTVIYATTNRVHLVKETFSSREGNEIHYSDTIDETVSLSDRFGIILTFSLLTKVEYIDIVKQMAQDDLIEINDFMLKKAEEFAILKGIRTPRCARQFITNYVAVNNK